MTTPENRGVEGLMTLVHNFASQRADAASGLFSSDSRAVDDAEKAIRDYAAALAAAPQQHCQCPACRHGVTHKSDCAVHNLPAMPNGPCDCGALERHEWLSKARGLVRAVINAVARSERSIARGGPELEVPCAIAEDALDDHLKAFTAPAPSQSHPTSHSGEAATAQEPHFCWTCKHHDKTIHLEPCSSCVIFSHFGNGHSDRWEADTERKD